LFYQDRLGTNIGKALKKRAVFLQDVIVDEQAKGHYGRELGPDGPLFAPGATHALAPGRGGEGEAKL
jgi:hypothetical protein